MQVRLDQRDAVFVAAGHVQVVERHLVHREEAAGRAVLRRHVADRGAVGEAQFVQPRAEELHELAHHALAAEHLRHRQHEVGRGGALRQLAGHAEADHVGDQHGDRLAEHRRLGLDAADAPAQDAETVHHRGVAVGAVQRVGIGDGLAVRLAGPHALAEILQVHLVADAGARRHDAEVVERVLAPAQEAVALAVALELDVDVLRQRVGTGEDVDLDRVVDHQIHRHQRIDLLRIAAEPRDAVAHRGEIDHRGHAGEVLQQDAGGRERHFLVGVRGGSQPAIALASSTV